MMNDNMPMFTIDGLDLYQTCGAFPEQYDVFCGDTKVGYLRLRHGEFYAAVPDCGGFAVYWTEQCLGDGHFEDDERMAFLTEAVSQIRWWLDATPETRARTGLSVEGVEGHAIYNKIKTWRASDNVGCADGME